MSTPASGRSRTSLLTGRRVLAASLAGVLVLAVLGVFVAFFSSRHPAPMSEPTPGAPVVAFYGDSYTAGTGASDVSKRWSTVLSRDRGWNEFNPSIDGLGFINNRRAFGSGDLPDLVIRQNPRIVFVTMGLNDNFSYESDAQKIKAQITDDLRRLRDDLPNARLIVVEPFWYSDARPRSVEVIISWVEAAAESVGADYIAGASHWLDGHPEWIAADGFHPNDDGYAAIAARMAQP